MKATPNFPNVIIIWKKRFQICYCLSSKGKTRHFNILLNSKILIDKFTKTVVFGNRAAKVYRYLKHEFAFCRGDLKMKIK